MQKYAIGREATDDNIIRCMRFACWVPKDTKTHSEYVILFFSTETVVTRTGLNVTLSVHSLACLKSTVVYIQRNFEVVMAAHSVQNLLSSRLLSKNLKIKIYRTIILPIVLHGCETWSLTLREERKLRVFENMVLRRIFGPRWDEVTGNGGDSIIRS